MSVGSTSALRTGIQRWPDPAPVAPGLVGGDSITYGVPRLIERQSSHGVRQARHRDSPSHRILKTSEEIAPACSV